MTETFRPAQPIWCAGCGHFGVQAALVRALKSLSIAPHETMVLAGIGCSGTVQNNLPCYGYHAMHGRVLPTAVGAKLANPNLAVIAVGGDGDGYAIGAGHLVHAFKRNPSVLYLVMNNATYGLTKGQDSPSKALPRSAPEEVPIDAVNLGLSIGGSSFIARGFTSWSTQLDRLMLDALQHVRKKRGFAFLEVLSPCVTYNDTYPEWLSTLYDVDQDPQYSPEDRAAAFALSVKLESEGRIPAGQIFCAERPTYDDTWFNENHLAPALQDVGSNSSSKTLEDIISGYAV